MQVSRRAFFGLRRPSGNDALRPPWAVAGDAFMTACTRCDACIEACPTALLVRGDGGYPEAVFRNDAQCTFCADCLSACTDGALRRIDGQAPWSLRPVFGDACLAGRQVVCRTCGESCEAGAIRFPPRLGGVAQPQLDSEGCTGCGACVADCPTQAIRMLAAPSHSIALQGAA